MKPDYFYILIPLFFTLFLSMIILLDDTNKPNKDQRFEFCLKEPKCTYSPKDIPDSKLK